MNPFHGVFLFAPETAEQEAASEQTRERIRTIFKDKHYEMNPSAFVVLSEGLLAQQIAERIGVGGGETRIPASRGAVIKLMSHIAGFAPNTFIEFTHQDVAS